MPATAWRTPPSTNCVSIVRWCGAGQRRITSITTIRITISASPRRCGTSCSVRATRRRDARHECGLRMRRAAPLIVAALAATLAVPILLGGRDALWQALDFSARGYAVLLSVVALSWFARALKIRLLLQRLNVRAGYWQVFLISLATDFAFISTPG